jgi:hypothetical protein
MTTMRLSAVVVLTASLSACAAKAQVRTEVPLPVLDPPPPPPRVVAEYPAPPEPIVAAPPIEPAVAAKPVARPARPEQRPEPGPVAAGPVESGGRLTPAPSLTLTPTPGSEAQTVAAIRDLLGHASRDLSKVNPAALNNDGRSQFDTARRFMQQAEDALKARNVVLAGKLADKAATMAAVLVR